MRSVVKIPALKKGSYALHEFVNDSGVNLFTSQDKIYFENTETEKENHNSVYKMKESLSASGKSAAPFSFKFTFYLFLNLLLLLLVLLQAIWSFIFLFLSFMRSFLSTNMEVKKSIVY